MTLNTKTKLHTAFATARASGIEQPRLRFLDFTLSSAPSSGKNPGYIYIKSTRDREYLGKISPEGAVYLCHKENFSPSIATDLENIIANPYLSTKVYGAQTGSCSCCGRKLTNALSVRLGIGPICREKFGWVDPEEDRQNADLTEQLDLLLSL